MVYLVEKSRGVRELKGEHSPAFPAAHWPVLPPAFSAKLRCQYLSLSLGWLFYHALSLQYAGGALGAGQISFIRQGAGKSCLLAIIALGMRSACRISD